MDEPDKSVFISYRRKLNTWPARSIFEHLKNSGYDVFMDVESIDSGNFESIILHQIGARTHFLAVLTPNSLVQTTEPRDWLRLEIEHAIKLERNVVPVMVGGFDFKSEAEKFPRGQFPGELEKLREFNGVNVPEDYFGDAMRKLRDRFLKKPTRVAITPAPQSELSEVKRKIDKTINSSPDQSILNTFGLKPFELKPFVLSKIPLFTLPAPTLSVKWRSLEWTSVPRATGYVLERSRDPMCFWPSIEVYKGDKTKYRYFSVSLPSLPRLDENDYFRVKAENDTLNLESPWSNVVTIDRRPLEDLLSLKPLKPEDLLSLKPLKPEDLLKPAPKLEVVQSPSKFSLPTRTYGESTPFKPIFMTHLKWTNVPKAISYELQSSYLDPFFANPKEEYKGDKTAFDVFFVPAFTSYRVRASDGLLFTSWSNIVTMDAQIGV